MGRKKLKKSTKKFLKNTKLRKGLEKRRKMTQKIRKEKEIKNARLLNRNLYDRKKEEERNIKRHLGGDSEKDEEEEEIEFDDLFRPKKDLDDFLSFNRIFHINMDMDIESKNNIPRKNDEVSSSTTIHEDFEKMKEGNDVSGILRLCLITEKIDFKLALDSILPYVIQYYIAKFRKKNIYEEDEKSEKEGNGNSNIEFFRVVASTTKEYRSEDKNLKMLFQVILKLLYNLLVNPTLENKDGLKLVELKLNLFKKIRYLIPFMGRNGLPSLILLNKLVIHEIRGMVMEEEAGDNEMLVKYKKVVFMFLYTLSCFFPFPIVKFNIQQMFNLYFSYVTRGNNNEKTGNDRYLSEICLSLCSIELEVSSHIVFEKLKLLEELIKNLDRKSNVPLKFRNTEENEEKILKILEIVNQVFVRYGNNSSLNKLIFSVVNFNMFLLDHFYKKRSKEKNIEKMKFQKILKLIQLILRISLSCSFKGLNGLHLPVLVYLKYITNSTAQRDDLEEQKSVLLVLNDFVALFSTSISFEENVYQLNEMIDDVTKKRFNSDLTKSNIMFFEELKLLQSKMKKYSNHMKAKRSDAKFKVVDMKEVDDFEDNLENDKNNLFLQNYEKNIQRIGNKRKRIVNEDDGEEKSRPHKKRKLD